MVEITCINLSCTFHLARDLLTLLASTIASKSVFSKSGRVLTHMMNRLASNAIKMTLHACTLHGWVEDEAGRRGACMSACMLSEYEMVVTPLCWPGGLSLYF